MTNSERLALFARGSRAPVVQQLSVSTSSQSCVRTTLSQISGFQLYSRLSFLSCLPPPHPISGVVSVSLSVVLGVEEDQSESAPAHARHERGAHHPAFSADQVDQENDWWDHRMSAEWCREEYLKIKPAEALSEKKNKKTTRLIILMNFCTSYGPFWEERATFSLCFLLSQHLM